MPFYRHYALNELKKTTASHQEVFRGEFITQANIQVEVFLQK